MLFLTLFRIPALFKLLLKKAKVKNIFMLLEKKATAAVAFFYFFATVHFKNGSF